jgi:hypothetical protein
MFDAAIECFVREWSYEDWMGLNPNHVPLEAESPQWLCMLVRAAVPECSGVPDAVIATALARIGHPITQTGAETWRLG